MVFEYGPEWQTAFAWIVYASFAMAFLVAFGMGANDCANSYGTVVGSGVLKLWQAYILATIFELLGAVLLGYKVTNTMRKSIVNVSIYDVYSQPFWQNGTTHYRLANDTCDVVQIGRLFDNQDVNGSYALNSSANDGCTIYTGPDFMIGELGVLIGTAFWLIFATVIHLPVSTTHSAVGATIGFSLVLKGTGGINWWTILNIVISWIASPVLAGFFSILFYLVIKYTVFNRAYPFESSLQMMPIFYFFALTVNWFSILYDGSKYLMFDRLSWWADLLISLTIGLVAALIILAWGKRIIRQRVLKKMTNLAIDNKSSSTDNKNCVIHNGNSNRLPKDALKTSSGQIENASTGEPPVIRVNASPKDALFAQISDNGTSNDSGFQMTPARYSKFQTRNTSNFGTQMGSTLSPTPYLDRRKETAIDAHSLKEKLKRLKHPVEENPLASQVFNYLQILSACFLSFSHGSNDTANAVGPLVGIWLAYKSGHAAVESKYDSSMILLILFGAVSMIVGLWLLGHKVIGTIGTKLTQVTPPSGFAMELGTGFTVLFASKIGIPVSTTHCAVGAVVCVGWFRSHEGGVSWKIFRNIALAWAVTLPVAGAVAAVSAYLLKVIFL